MEPSDILDAGKGFGETTDEIIEDSGKVMGAAGMVGGGEAAATILAGGAAELGVGAAVAGGATIGAAVVGAGAVGYGIGTYIENETGIGSAAGDAAFNATSEETHQAALEHFENAEANWDQGNYGTAVLEGAESVGTIAGGLLESAGESIGSALDSINPFSDD
jgi:hypothetical protein